ncbi:RDD family protein [Gordonia rubripertincta]|uniref:RDD family protein n=1 Tax=Gordonia rubripertincta TaxID=36822 RepID=UPI000B8D8746|nr:RDD family protein [Gordonia rubripertincta]ASR03093.1 RDD family protein [Gordonia rubripertincta]
MKVDTTKAAARENDVEDPAEPDGLEPVELTDDGVRADAGDGVGQVSVGASAHTHDTMEVPGVDENETDDNVSADEQRRYASWSVQAVAFVVDAVVPVGIVVTLGCIAAVMGRPLWLVITTAVLAAAVLIVTVANIVVWQGKSGYTIGKGLVGAKTLRDGAGSGSLGVWRSAARQSAHVIDTVPLLVGWLLPLRDRRRQTFADKIVSSEVVRTSDESPAIRRRSVALTLTLLLGGAVSIVGLLAAQYFHQDRSDRATTQTQAAIAEIATDSTIRLLSYKPETVDADLKAASADLTGNFLHYYRKYTNDVVIPAAKEKKVNTEAQSAGSAVVSADPDHAVVLVFVNQTTTTSDNPQPSKVASTVRVNLVKSDDRWLISDFQPI